MPSPVALSQFVPQLFRFPRFLVGRFYRRRHRRQVRRSVQRGRPGGRWWSPDERWFGSGFPPRQHNALLPLVDGRDTFAALLDAVRRAEEYIYIVGWALTPTFALDQAREDRATDDLLTEVLAAVSPRVAVKILLWGGSPLLFQPTRRVTSRARDALLQAAPRIDCRLDDLAHPTHCHHQKAVVVDGQVGFVGGLDLTTIEGNRWDLPGHPLRFGRNWHDVALQVRGEAVADLEENFRQRWAAVTGEHDLPHRDPVIEPAWHTPCQIVRTIPRRVYPFARRGEYGIAHAYLAAIAGAERFIYLENQYL
jgi:phosphatidylserine/phosphatidylglycerophosphate/cardiolipin synthase-like enzyme